MICWSAELTELLRYPVSALRFFVGMTTAKLKQRRLCFCPADLWSETLIEWKKTFIHSKIIFCNYIKQLLNHFQISTQKVLWNCNSAPILEAAFVALSESASVPWRKLTFLELLWTGWTSEFFWRLLLLPIWQVLFRYLGPFRLRTG